MKRLRILWLSHFVPYPPKGGAFQRSYHLITRVGAAHDLHLIAMKHKAATHPLEELRDARKELLRHCRSVDIVDVSSLAEGAGLLRRALTSVLTGAPLSVAMFRSPDVRRRLRNWLARETFDVVHLDTISVADYLEDVGRLPVLMAHMGAESFMIRRRIAHERSVARRTFFKIEAVALERCERRVLPRIHMNVAVSELDVRLMREVAPEAPFTVVDNGVDLEYFAPAPPGAGHRLQS
jgi:glycosyltransferase involved in cell wall biosynthesis